MLNQSLRRLWMTLALILLSACTQSSGDSAATDAAPPAARLVTIGSNPAGTHVYTVAGGLAKILQENGIRTTIRPFSGSSVYLPLLQRGELGMGLNISIDSYLAYAGLPPYETPMQNLRMLGMIFPLPIMYMVRADSDIQRVEDLRSRRVVITFRANVALEQLHTGILATGGLTPDDVDSVVVAGLPEAMRMLTEGRADAVPTGLNTALALQVNSSLPDGIRYITMGAQENRLAEVMPGSEPVSITPSTPMVGVPETIRVAGIVDYLNTSTAMSEQQAYDIIRVIYQNWEMLRRDYSQMAGTSRDAIAPARFFHPYHAGAVRFYTEVGMWTSAHAETQQRLLNLHE